MFRPLARSPWLSGPLLILVSLLACGRDVGPGPGEQESALRCVANPNPTFGASAATTCACDGGSCGDGGVDGGPPDGGPDGGPPPDGGQDGGLDGGPGPDAGQDGGPGDGGSDGGSDGGMSDGGSSDGGQSDGGTGGSGDGGSGSDGGSSDGGSGGNDGGSGDGGSGDGGSGSDGGSSDGGSGGDDGGTPGDGDDGGTGGGGGGGGSSCSCSNGVCTNSQGDSCLDLKVVPVNRESGAIESEPALLISTPRPVIQIQAASLTVEGLAPSPYGLTGYLSIQGYVFSGVADTTPGATIDSVRLYVQGRPDPIILPLQVFKDSGGALGAPYPYYGVLQAFVPIDGLLPDEMGNAWVNFRIEANDPIGHGVGEASFTVDLSPMDQDLFPQELFAQTPEANFYDWSDDTHPSVIRVTGPTDLLSKDGFTVETFDGQRRVIKWDDGQYYIATRDGSRPEVMLAVPNENGDEGDWLYDDGSDLPPSDPGEDAAGIGVLKRSQASPRARAGGGPAAFGDGGLVDSFWFLSGFVVGFGEGGVDLVSGTVKVAVAIPRSTIDGVWALITHPRSTLQEAWDQGWAAAYFVRDAGWTVIQIGTNGADFLRKVVAGDPEALQVGDATLRAALQMTGELISEAWNDYLDLVRDDPYQAGRIFGRGMFEVAALVAPYAKAGQLSNLSKLQFLENLQAEIQAGRVAFFRSARVQQKLGKIILWTRELIRLCFPAGTPVLTPDGPVPIERIKAGDRVISRDPITGQQTARTVLDTVSTTPTRLFHVRYRLTEPVVAPEARWAGTVAHRSSAGRDSPDDGEPPAEVVSTGTHPFFVVQKQAFVEAALLVPGDRLRLASGGSAEVLSVEPEDAAPGQHFVTYNLEVEEFHTYFAGADALWVHNYGFSCEKFVALLQDTETWIKTTFGVTDIHPWDLFQMTFQRNFGVRKPGKVDMDPEDIKKLLQEYAALFPDRPPRTVRYADWPKREEWLKTQFNNTQIQGNHWWPHKDLGEGALAGGANGEGAVFPLATPYLHTGDPHGIHVRMRAFFKKEFGVETMDQVKQRFASVDGKTGQDLFDAQQALLKRFWKEEFSLEMPTFSFMADKPELNYGRGVFSGIQKR